MRKKLVFFVAGGLFILLGSAFAQAQCPEDPNDLGICDTLYVDADPSDLIFTGPGHLVEVPIRFTHDLDPYGWDSLAYFYVPLCFSHSNPSKYCSLSGYWNNRNIYPFPHLEHSVFRHLGEETNIIMQAAEEDNFCYSLCWWDLDLDGISYFGLPLGPEVLCCEDLFGDGSRLLLATMTFRVEDTMTICIDTCFLPLTGNLRFWASAGIYTPRDNMPYHFSISYTQIGDANADGTVDGSDVVYLINYLFRFGSEPVPLWVGDVNCNGDVNSGDIVYLISYLFRGGPGPCEG